MSIMQIGFEIVAARPKGEQAEQDQPVQEPMRGHQPTIRRAPSQDQLKARRQMARQQRTATERGPWGYQYDDEIHCPDCVVGGRAKGVFMPLGKDDLKHADPSGEHCDTCGEQMVAPQTWRNPQPGIRGQGQKTATEIPTSAWQLNAGDAIRGPSNSTVKVQRVHPHKTDRSLVLVETEQGQLEVKRDHQFNLVRGDSRQKELPTDQGFAGGNTNSLPGSPNSSSPVNAPGDGGVPKCPVCGAALQARNAGGNSLLVCPRDGYAQQASGLGAQTDPNIIRNRRASMNRTSANKDCPDCGGSGAVPAAGYEPAEDVDNGYVQCPTCKVPEPRKEAVLIVVQADMRGKAGECRLCGGDLKVDSVDHTENTVHAHCGDCGAEHQVQNVHHQQTASKPVVQVSGLDSRYATTTGHPSAIARRAHAVLALPEEN